MVSRQQKKVHRVLSISENFTQTEATRRPAWLKVSEGDTKELTCHLGLFLASPWLHHYSLFMASGISKYKIRATILLQFYLLLTFFLQQHFLWNADEQIFCSSSRIGEQFWVSTTSPVREKERIVCCSISRRMWSVCYGQTIGSMLADAQEIAKLLATPWSAARGLKVMKDWLPSSHTWWQELMGKEYSEEGKTPSDVSIWILKGTGFYCQRLSQWHLCLGCFSWLHWLSQYKMQHNSDCPVLFMSSLWELGSDFSLNTSFTASYSDSAESIHIFSTKQRMKGIMEKEKDTIVTEKDEFHWTSTLQVAFIGIKLFSLFFKHKVLFKIHVI